MRFASERRWSRLRWIALAPALPGCPEPGPLPSPVAPGAGCPLGPRPRLPAPPAPPPASPCRPPPLPPPGTGAAPATLPADRPAQRVAHQHSALNLQRLQRGDHRFGAHRSVWCFWPGNRSPMARQIQRDGAAVLGHAIDQAIIR